MESWIFAALLVLRIQACSAADDSQCEALKGTCQDVSMTCDGAYLAGKCAGSSSRRCCVSPDMDCLVMEGTCQDDSLTCSGSYHTGLCAGSSSRRCCVSQSSSSTGTCANLALVSRSGWGAQAATSRTSISTPVEEFFIHHTDTPTCNDVTACAERVRSIQNYHMGTRGWSDIGYSFLVGSDGSVFEGRGWDYVGAHTSGFNSKSFAASMIGTFDSQLPTGAALKAVQDLIACGVEQGKIVSNYRLYGHRDAGTTSCPGDDLYAEIQKWSHYSKVTP